MKRETKPVLWYRKVFSILIGVYLIFSSIQLAGFGETDNEKTTPQSERKQKTEFSLADIDKLTKEVGKLRGLDFKNPVKSGIKTREELKQRIIADFEKEVAPEEIIKNQKALIKLGLIPKDTDLKKLMTDLLAEQIVGFYDPKDKELYLIKPRKDDEPPKDAELIEQNFGIPYYYITVVHELTHALQDQYFDLLTLPSQNNENDDLATAVKAVVEGEATFMMYYYLLRKIGQDITLIPDVSKASGVPPTSGMEVINKESPYIKEGLLFPYIQGLGFIHRVKAAGGWSAVTKLYDKLPASTEQILHPEKYLGENPDYPIEVKLPDFVTILPAEEWELLLKDTLGEFNIEILLREFIPNLRTKEIAEGWGGDQFAVYENKKSHEIIVVWFLTWDTAKDATEFTEAYYKLISKKYAGYDIVNQTESETAWANGENVIYLEQKGKNVIIIETVAQKLLSPLLVKVSNDTKCTELKEVKRIIPAKDKKNTQKF